MNVPNMIAGLASGVSLALVVAVDMSPHVRPAVEVVVAFDSRGLVSESYIARSSGSRTSDAAAIGAARELASLHSPANVAGRALLIKVGSRV